MSKFITISTAVMLAFTALFVAPPATAAPSDGTVFKASSSRCYRIPAVVADASGRLYAFAERRQASCSDNGAFDIVMKTKSPGSSWSEERTVVKGSGNRVSNPVPMVKNGTVYLVYTFKNNKIRKTEGMHVVTSTNSGASWSKSRPVMAGYTLSGPGHGAVLASGRMIFATGQGGIYSDNDGRSWQWGYKFTNSEEAAFIEGSITELTPGKLLVCYRADGFKRSHRCATSTNGGASVSKFMASTYNMPFTASVQGSLLKLAGTNRVLYSMPTDPTARKGLGIYSAKTSTTGTSPVRWDGSRPHLVNGKSTPAAYSDLVQVGSSRVGILYETGSGSPYERIVYNETSISNVTVTK